MMVVYEFDNGEVMIADGNVDEKTFHMKIEYAKKTVYDSGVIIITPDLKIEQG
jgi:hypothetical protein